MSVEISNLYKKIFALALTIFLINLFWEIVHTSLYGTEMHHFGVDFDLPLTLSSLNHYFLMWIVASLGDVFYVLLIIMIPAVWHRKIFWFNEIKFLDAAIIFCLGLVVATLIEMSALREGRWVYNQFMPIIPYLNVGLTPFIQLGTTALISLLLFPRNRASL